ncbi:MAG TPA: type VII secretion integral membrane protein EccD [Actinophytocola sp.]|jgi:type VII secretion integral membrane protein EccD|uniref:type VII secretion integral membrane protein EccD n=1 Tax=Actinophytocola sp. TaxID=1872138 RepID=UPI002E07FEEA|nr:type VII secretion integral membrane protein EccD [Actinophytocola sp.]
MRTYASDLCRVVLVTPNGPVEMALPAGVPICDLLPTLVHHSNSANGAGRRQYGDDWVVQRFGEAPFDEERSPAELKVRDGETLHLRTRDDTLPAVHFDDLIDGVAAGMRHRRDRWRDWMTRRALLAVSGLALLVGLVVLLLDGPVAPRAAAAGGVALALVTGGMVASRAFGEAPAGVLLGGAAVPFAALAGLLGVTAPLPPSLAAANVFAAAAGAGLAALLAAVAVGAARSAFGAVVLTGAAAVVGGLLATVGGMTAWQAGAVVGAAAVTVSTTIPTSAFWLAKLRLPALPTGPEDLSADVEPYAVGQLLDRTAAADRYMTAMFTATGVIAAASLALLAPVGGTTAVALTLAISGVLLLRARAMTSAWQRLATLGPAVLGLALLVLHFAAGPALPVRMYWLVIALGAAGVAVAFAQLLPGRRLLPYWGRAGDIFEWVVAISILPLTLGLLGVFGWARSLAG